MAPQFVFEMHDVSKLYGNKVVLQDISLSFFYGAKIGVVGENGAGKSTLLKIMAGLDKDIHGTASLAKGMSVRYVAQEPQLDLDKTVRENLRMAMKPIQDLVDRFNAISDQLGDPPPAPTPTSCWRRWDVSRKRSTPATAGRWTGSWTSPPMHWCCRRMTRP